MILKDSSSAIAPIYLNDVVTWVWLFDWIICCMLTECSLYLEFCPLRHFEFWGQFLAYVLNVSKLLSRISGQCCCAPISSRFDVHLRSGWGSDGLGACGCKRNPEWTNQATKDGDMLRCIAWVTRKTVIPLFETSLITCHTNTTH